MTVLPLLIQIPDDFNNQDASLTGLKDFRSVLAEGLKAMTGEYEIMTSMNSVSPFEQIITILRK